MQGRVGDVGKKIITDAISREIRGLAGEGLSDPEISREIARRFKVHVKVGAITQHRLRRGIPSTWAPRVRLVHGTPSAYQIHGCRCDVCRAGNTNRMADYNHRIRQEDLRSGKVERTNLPWEEWEDRIANDRTRPVREVARMLHRTQVAVRLRRTHLGLSVSA